MDRALIERMVGAVVLVLLLVVVAPALLDGTRLVSTDEDGLATDGENRTQVILLNEPETRNEPVDTKQNTMAGIEANQDATARSREQSTEVEQPSAPAVSAPAPAAEPVVKKPVSEPVRPTGEATKPAVKEPAAAPSASSGFAVQLGSFRERANAEQFAGGLKQKGFSVFVRSGRTSSGTVYRVYAGPRSNRGAAEKLAMTLANVGYSGMVVDMSNK